MRRQIAIVTGVLGALVAAQAQGADNWARDVDMREFFKNTVPLRVEPQREEKVFPASQNQAGFTYFHGVEDLDSKNGILSFTVSEDRATLGWGNYANKQNPLEVVPLFPEECTVEVRLRQSCTGSVWKAQLWVDGKAIKPWSLGRHTVSVAGKEWQVASFAPTKASYHPIPDGFEIEISAPRGTEIEIENVKVVRSPKTGYLRKEFTLPQGKVWKAVADVAWGEDRRWCRTKVGIALYVNGQRVERRTAEGIYAVRPVSIKQFLRPGRNCVGFHAWGCWMPIPLKLTVVMESGEVVEVHTGTDWRRTGDAPEGWSKPGFNDTEWELCSWAQGTYGADQQTKLPGDHSLFRLGNPYKRDLFYGTTRNVILLAQLPRGLRGRAPTVEYVLERGQRSGDYKPVTRGKESLFTLKQGSLVYTLDLGKLPQGVYTVALRASDAQGTIMAERTREPLVVIGNEPQELTPGAEYAQGLDLELEAEIDFTNPNDPHPNWESEFIDWGAETREIAEPKIVRKGGLTYRELVGKTSLSGMSYRLGEFEHPGDFYLMELDYPDDAHRIIDVFVAPTRNSLDGTGVGVELLVKRNLSVRADWGIALDATEKTDVGNSEIHFVATLLY